MPPKPKFTKEEVVATALQLVSERGIEGLTARELGQALGSSARPIFTVFRNMEELQVAVRKAAMKRFESYADTPLPGLPRFKSIGIQMVRFGLQEPKLYQLLFMQENTEGNGFEGIYGALGDEAEISIRAIQTDYGLTEPQARRLFEAVWVYTFGIGALCATRACAFTEAQLGEMLTTQFRAAMLLIQSEKADQE